MQSFKAEEKILKRISVFFFLVIVVFGLVSCSEKEQVEIKKEETTKVIEVETPKIEEIVAEPQPSEPEIDPTKTEISLLTGLPCTPEVKNMRPIAVMINNLHQSYPQQSISYADILYECDMEGGITRLMGIYNEFKNVGNIGSTRSARDYFVEIADSHDAIFVHAGGSPSAYERIKNSKTDNIDGVNMYSIADITFWRDKDRIKQCGYEHSMMTSGEKVCSAIDLLKYRTEFNNSYSSFCFNEEFKEPVSLVTANSLTLEHSEYLTVKFDYDEDKKEYFKYSFGEEHIDGTNGVQLSFTNVLILYVKEKVVDEVGRLQIELNTSGKGIYLTGGKALEIEWTKDKNGSPFSFTYNGDELCLNPGKTHITLFNKNREAYVIIQ